MESVTTDLVGTEAGPRCCEPALPISVKATAAARSLA